MKYSLTPGDNGRSGDITGLHFIVKRHDLKPPKHVFRQLQEQPRRVCVFNTLTHIHMTAYIVCVYNTLTYTFIHTQKRQRILCTFLTYTPKHSSVHQYIHTHIHVDTCKHTHPSRIYTHTYTRQGIQHTHSLHAHCATKLFDNAFQPSQGKPEQDRNAFVISAH